MDEKDKFMEELNDVLTIFQDVVKREITAVEQRINQRMDDKINKLRQEMLQLDTKRVKQAIRTDVSTGLRSKEVAVKYEVGPNYVTNVAPRALFAPGNNLRQ